MRISALSIPLLAALILPSNVHAQSDMPAMSSVTPASGRVGDIMVVQGTNLDRDNVAALYLTDGQTDVKVPIIEQTATSIKFKIPPEAKSGRLSLMVLTKGNDPKLIQEPVKITVESDTTDSST